MRVAGAALFLCGYLRGVLLWGRDGGRDYSEGCGKSRGGKYSGYVFG